MAHETAQATTSRWKARRRRPTPASEPPAAPAPRREATPPTARNALRVLVVDDERLSRQTAVRQLQESGFAADAVESGRRALRRAGCANHGTWCSAIICACPAWTGWELLRAIGQTYPAVDVVVMTAYGTVETAVTAIRSGAADYLTKPFPFQELEHRLRKLGELRGFPARSGRPACAPGRHR